MDKAIPFAERLRSAIGRAGAPLCIGLDPDPKRLPAHLGLGAAALRVFLSEIITATRDLAAAYKANTAFFEAYGPEGWAELETLKAKIGVDCLLIVDAKRGDVEHTNEAYATAVWERIRADAVTVQPYLGGEALIPFSRYSDRGMFVLCATSNAGAKEVQGLGVDGRPLYVEIAKKARSWSVHANVGLVVGTTQPEALEAVLKEASDLAFLLPGGGAQGGDTERVQLLMKQYGAAGLLTFSRSVLYASSGEDFAEAARAEALRLRRMLASHGGSWS